MWNGLPKYLLWLPPSCLSQLTPLSVLSCLLIHPGDGEEHHGLHGGDRDSHRGAHGPDWEVVLGSHRFCWLELSHSYLQCPSYCLTSCSGPHYLELSTLLHLTHSYSVRFLSQVLILPPRSFLLVPNLSSCPTHMTMMA